ncbi:hypothetical protein N9L47_12160 [Rhodobacteraceae bacterium]|nr:hypothetical protein [Paracoccaceae bacterium]
MAKTLPSLELAMVFMMFRMLNVAAPSTALADFWKDPTHDV